MPRFDGNLPHCVNCQNFSPDDPSKQCAIRAKIEGLYDEVDEVLKQIIGVDVYYHLYSFVCRCSLFELRKADTAEDVLHKFIAGEVLTEDEQALIDRILAAT